MQQLKVVNPTAIDLGDVFGIPTQRLIEISQALDNMVKKASNGSIRLVYTVDILNHIRSICNTEEEYTWAFYNHIMWMARTGRAFTTNEAQAIAIKKYGNPENL